MKNKNILIITSGVFCLLALVNLGFGYLRDGSKNDIGIVVHSLKDTYLLGEPIQLQIDVNNLTGKELVLVNSLDPVYGSLKLYVSSEDKSVDYQYMSPKSGILDTSGFTKIGPREKQSKSIQILARLTSYDQAEYFFERAGTYYLHASYQIHLVGEPKPIEIKSEPIRIIIDEPRGDDLVVWNLVKDSGNFAYFIQEGEILIPSWKSGERAKLQQKVEQIVNRYPNSFYAESLRQSLVKYRANEARRQEFTKKMQKSQ